MPLVSTFYGIVVRMYSDDHQPARFLASYQGNEATFSLEGEVMEGELPAKQRKLICAWAQIHRDELQAT